MSGPKSGIINDPAPFQLPEIDKQSAPKRIPKSDWARLGNSRKFKDVDQYLEIRKDYWKHFLPGGEAIREFAAKGQYEEAGKWSAVASVIVDEIENFQLRIQKETGK